MLNKCPNRYGAVFSLKDGLLRTSSLNEMRSLATKVNLDLKCVHYTRHWYVFSVHTGHEAMSSKHSSKMVILYMH